MPSIKKQVEIAVYAALNVSSVTDLATQGVWQGKAGESVSSYPFVVFGWQAHGEVEYTFTFGQAVESGLFLLKSYADEDSDATKDPSDLNDEILEVCTDILHSGITLGTGEMLYFRKHSDTPELEDQMGDRSGVMNGRLFKVVAEQ